VNKLHGLFCILVTFVFFTTACGPQANQTKVSERQNPSIANVQDMIGKPLSDHAVAKYILGNNCSSNGYFQLCYESGLALWVDTNEMVKSIYLYSGNADGFNRYPGKLPYGITFYDPMWLVIDKLKSFDEGDALNETSIAGLPETEGSPDHMHYWAEYKRFNMIVIYNEPFPDEDAYIYAVVLKSSDT